MSDLISRSEMIRAIEEHYINLTNDNVPRSIPDFYSEMQKLVYNQPTAFDTEMVVEQLMIIHDEGYCPNEDGLECVLNKACSDCYREKIIDIVKKGGVE